jgi:hypothetical protein
MGTAVLKSLLAVFSISKYRYFSIPPLVPAQMLILVIEQAEMWRVEKDLSSHPWGCGGFS